MKSKKRKSQHDLKICVISNHLLFNKNNNADKKVYKKLYNLFFHFMYAENICHLYLNLCQKESGKFYTQQTAIS